MRDLESDIVQKLQALEKTDALRQLKKTENLSDKIDLSNNDYLGIANCNHLQLQFYQEYALALTSSSSRLLSGNHLYYRQVENLLSEQYGKSALFFNSGYHLNIGVLPALTNKQDLILADKLIHASLIEGLRLSYAKTIRYRHLDYEHLEQLLERYAQEYQRIFIVSESLFSMDGDIANLKRLVNIKKQYQAYLYIDEAHAVGACGQSGLGLAESFGLIDKIDFLVGTMGKALASVGAFIICNKPIKKYLINTCKSLIYTTALPPVNMAWTYTVLKQIPLLKHKRERLLNNIKYLSKLLEQNQIPFVGNSHIMAIITNDNTACLELAQHLKTNGICVQAVRPPTVPEGTARIRLSLNADLSFNDLEKLVSLIEQF